jgi:dihydroxyacetone kinase
MAATAHLTNTPAAITAHYTAALAHPALAPHAATAAAPASNIVARADLATYRLEHVCVVAAAGSGHEPMFSGLVSAGSPGESSTPFPAGLSAAVSGGLCAAPSAQHILDGIALCTPPAPARGRGILLVLSNYTGDMLAAGQALSRLPEKQRADVRLVVVDDDVAIGRAQLGRVGRRGLAGHILLLRIASHMAAGGASLDAIHSACESLKSGLGSIGVAFNRCALPIAPVTPIETLPPDTISLGMGIHGEPGFRNISPVPKPDALVDEMVGLVLDRQDVDRSYVDVGRGDDVAVFVNSLGATDWGAVTIFSALVVAACRKRGVGVAKVLRGRVVTSFSMSGFSVSVLRLPRAGEALEAGKVLEALGRGFHISM